MTKRHGQGGFTLVELAIVMTIIGLIIGGILKGQEMVVNARVTATIAQVQGYNAAVSTFRDKYEAMPGDMVTAAARIPGCTAACTPTLATEAGNNIVGLQTWGAGGWLTQSGAAVALMAGQAQSETVLFWAHLLLSDLITGVSDTALAGGAPGWTTTHPQARVGGGFVVGFGDGAVPPGTPAGVTGPSGLILALVRMPTTGTVPTMIATGTQPLTPGRAAIIDRKMDDGQAATGYVRAYGAASCFGTNNSYTESTTSNDCGLVFRIQG